MTDKKILDADNQEKIKNEVLSNKQLEKVVGGVELPRNPYGTGGKRADIPSPSDLDVHFGIGK